MPEQQNGNEAPNWRGQLEFIDIEVLRRLRAYPSDIAWDELCATFGSEPVMRDNLVHAVHRLAERRWHLVEIDERRVGLTLAGRLAADQLGVGLPPLDYCQRPPGLGSSSEAAGDGQTITPLLEIDSSFITPSWGPLAGRFPDYTVDGLLPTSVEESPTAQPAEPDETPALVAESEDADIAMEPTSEAVTPVTSEDDDQAVAQTALTRVTAAAAEVQEPVAQADTPPDNVRVFPDTPEITSGQNTCDDRRAKVQMDVQQVTFIPNASGGEVQADVSSGRRKLVASWSLEGDESGLRLLLDQLMVKIEQVAFIPTPMGGQVRVELRVGEQTFVSTCWIDGQNTATQEAMQSLCQVVKQELLQAFTIGSGYASGTSDESNQERETAAYDAATPSWSPSAQ